MSNSLILLNNTCPLNTSSLWHSPVYLQDFKASELVSKIDKKISDLQPTCSALSNVNTQKMEEFYKNTMVRVGKNLLSGFFYFNVGTRSTLYVEQFLKFYNSFSPRPNGGAYKADMPLRQVISQTVCHGLFLSFSTLEIAEILSPIGPGRPLASVVLNLPRMERGKEILISGIAFSILRRIFRF